MGEERGEKTKKTTEHISKVIERESQAGQNRVVGVVSDWVVACFFVGLPRREKGKNTAEQERIAACHVRDHI